MMFTGYEAELHSQAGALDGVEAFFECSPTPKLSPTATPNGRG
jgi:hypothetical protein